MLFKQLFEKESSTYTYLISCQEKQEAILIDPVLETLQRDIDILNNLNLKLAYAIDTHIHADHVTSAAALREITNCKVAGPANDNLKCRDINLKNKDNIVVGSTVLLEAIYSPGHTNTHFSYMLNHNDNKLLFSGDALLINTCGRTDFQSGSSRELFNTIKNIFYKLPDDTKIYPAHDYNNKNYSTIKDQKNDNSFIDEKTNVENFVNKMKNLKLDMPKKIDYAVPINSNCGILNSD
ncbi:MAG: MBL fold metallo-hydrolase [Gammaproteobacteria bacterium]|jgi:sulfur dioxygenase|nr:MBL fold metallo-hydrolase [Gammaproteobacteria bacterium]MBT7603091.1 MBL fold metallo-hydrolase [Gammaproteobacteria bacterium]